MENTTPVSEQFTKLIEHLNAKEDAEGLKILHTGLEAMQQVTERQIKRVANLMSLIDKLALSIGP